MKGYTWNCWKKEKVEVKTPTYMLVESYKTLIPWIMKSQTYRTKSVCKNFYDFSGYFLYYSI